MKPATRSRPATPAPKRTGILLVHGTWGANSGWTRAAGPQPGCEPAPAPGLMAHLVERFGPEADIEVFDWSGSNSRTVRREAAVRLSRELERRIESGTHGRLHIIAHSHGGNIVYNALSLLDDETAQHVTAFYLCTPFLVEKPRQFPDIFPSADSILDDEPSKDDGFSRQMLTGIGLFAVLAVLPFLAYVLDWNPLVLTRDNFLALYRYWNGPLDTNGVLAELATLPWQTFLLVPAAVLCLVGAMVLDDLTGQSARLDMLVRARAARRRVDLVFTHSFDEAIAGLQILCNVFNFIQQVVFIGLAWMWRLIDYRQIFSLTFIASIAVWVGIGFAIRFIVWIFIVLSFLGFIGEAISGFLEGVLYWTAPLVVGTFLFLLYAGVLAFLSLLVIFLAGAVRYVALTLAGLNDSVPTLASVYRLVFGEVTVAHTPVGNSRIYMVPGNRVFNHTSIYEEPEVIERICAEIGNRIERRDHAHRARALASDIRKVVSPASEARGRARKWGERR